MSPNQFSDPQIGCFAFFYQTLGLRLHKTSSFCQKYPLFFWNILSTCLTIYGLFTCPFAYAKFHFDKPFLNWLNDVNNFNYAYMNSLLLLYYQIWGATIFQHLNSLSLSIILPEISTKMERLSSIVPFLFCQIHFAIGYTVCIISMIEDKNVTLLLINLPALYINFHYIQLTSFILYYAQTTILNLLQKLTQKAEQAPEGETVEQIKILAKWTKKLASYLSFPLVIYLASNSIDFLVNIAFLGATLKYYSIIFMLLTGGSLLYLVHLSWKIQQTLGQLSQGEATNYGHSNCLSPNSKKLQYHELSVYCESFQFKVYSVCSLDAAFMFAVFLFILNYGVLFLQTK